MEKDIGNGISKNITIDLFIEQYLSIRVKLNIANSHVHLYCFKGVSYGLIFPQCYRLELQRDSSE